MELISNIEIRIVKSWNSLDIVDLYRSGGWWREEWEPANLPRLIKGSFAFAVALDRKTNCAVGMGRVISDGVSDAYLQDVVVHPSYRHMGIGCLIVQELVAYCISAHITWIGLIAAPGTEVFYRELGFTEMKGYQPMLLGGRGDDLPR